MAGASFGNMGNWVAGLEFVVVLAGLSLVIQPVATSLTSRWLAARWPGKFRAVSWLALSGVNGLGLLAAAISAGTIGMAGSVVGIALLVAGYRSVLHTSWLWPESSWQLPS